MADVQSHNVKPGEKMNFRNHGDKGIKIKVVTADGTEIETNLHPGAHLAMIVGTGPANIYLFDSEQKYEKFQII